MMINGLTTMLYMKQSKRKKCMSENYMLLRINYKKKLGI